MPSARWPIARRFPAAPTARCGSTRPRSRETDFLTNRTGFIVLHPLTGVAGYPVEVEHVDKRKVKDKFPAIINPVQPFYGIRSLRHKVTPGVFATCRMEGDTFEMEDHRNWTDSSFKTYVRPLAEPWPYTLRKGVEIKQSVSLTFSGKLPRAKAAGRAKPIEIALGKAGGALPAIGVARSGRRGGRRLRQRLPDRAVGRPPPGVRGGRTPRRIVRRARRLSAPRQGDQRRRDPGDHPARRAVAGDRVRADRGGGEAERPHSRRDLGLARDGPARCPARQQGARRADAGGDLPGGARRLPGRPDRRRHLRLLHRAEPQAAADRASGFRHPHHVPDRACRRRCLGHGNAGGAALRGAIGQGLHQRQGLLHRPQLDSRRASIRTAPRPRPIPATAASA